MLDRIYIQHWLQLSTDVRTHLTNVFAIPYSGVREIRDQYLVSDGHSNDDLAVITSATMEEYVGVNDLFPRLWELTVAKATYELDPTKVAFIEETEEEFVPTDEIKTEDAVLEEITEEVKHVPIEKKNKQK